jgi:mono/diheme cytochrome c family protein
VTEIPDHLLRRSRERREALGLGGGGGEAPAGETAPAPAATPAPAAAAASAPAVEEEAGLPAVPGEEAPTYVAPSRPARTKVPLWVMPVLVGMPLWAALYPGSFTSHHKKVVLTPLQDGAQVYAGNCSSCHGASGEGGVGPKLSGGEVTLTFPTVDDHIAWVQQGSVTRPGIKYGSPTRAGGQHVASKGDMPAFASSLSAQQIADVVAYERQL